MVQFYQYTVGEVGKLIAFKRLAGLLGIKLTEAIAFGDDLNDLDLIRACGIGVAMGNAAPVVKEAADIVAGTNDQDGVAAVLEAIWELDADGDLTGTAD